MTAPFAPPTASRLLETIACIARLAQSELRARATELGLQLVHLQALAYLARANRYSNTAVALTEFLGTSKGTISQSLRLLTERGLIRREPDRADGRVVRLALTARGMKAIEALAFGDQWDAAVLTLPPTRVAGADEALTAALRALQRHAGGKSFGVCGTCRHFLVEGADAYRCGLTAEALSARDAALICREHSVATVAELRSRARAARG